MGVKLGVLAALSVMCIWSGWLVITRWGVTHSLTNIDILLLRFATASVVISPLLIRTSWYNLAQKFNIKTVVSGLACGIPYVWLSFIGLESSTIANAGVIVNGSLPIFTILIMYYLTKTTPNGMQISGMLLIIIANAALIIGGSVIGADTYITLLGAGVLLSIYTCVVKFWSVEAQDIIIVGPIVNLVIIIPIWIFSSSNIAASPAEEIFVQMIYQGGLVSVGALWLMSYSLKHISAHSFSLIMALVPVNAALMAYLFLGEELTLYVLIASALCTLGIITFNIHNITKKIYKRAS